MGCEVDVTGFERERLPVPRIHGDHRGTVLPTRPLIAASEYALTYALM